ncbi:MAG: hypothetical protein WDN01_16900 [Rhizomicrobium sp.]
MQEYQLDSLALSGGGLIISLVALAVSIFNAVRSVGREDLAALAEISARFHTLSTEGRRSSQIEREESFRNLLNYADHLSGACKQGRLTRYVRQGAERLLIDFIASISVLSKLEFEVVLDAYGNGDPCAYIEIAEFCRRHVVRIAEAIRRLRGTRYDWPGE